MKAHSWLALGLVVLSAAAAWAAEGVTRRRPPARSADVFPAPDTGPEIRTAIRATMEVRGWGALPTEPADLLKSLGAKVELCRHITDMGHGNYAYTVTCFVADKMFIGEDEEYKAYFAKGWNGKRAALRALAISGSLVVVEELHSVLLQGDDAYLWMLVYDRDGCKHPRHWRLVRVNRTRGDLTWVGDDMEEAGGEPREVKGKCINTGKKRRNAY